MKTWVKFGLIWAAWMFIIMTFIAPYILVWTGLEEASEPKFPVGKIVINAVVFTVGGLIFGYWNDKRQNKNKPRKQIDS